MTEEIVWSQVSNSIVVNVRYLYDGVDYLKNAIASDGPINDYIWDAEFRRFVLDPATARLDTEEEK